MAHHLTIIVHPDAYAICRLDPRESIPAWAAGRSFFSVTRTPGELSIVCLDSQAPPQAHAERNRRLLQIEGTLAFSLVGILAAVALPLADAGISIFCVATYDTDYLLVEERDLPQAIEALEAAGHKIRMSRESS